MGRGQILEAWWKWSWQDLLTDWMCGCSMILPAKQLGLGILHAPSHHPASALRPKPGVSLTSRRTWLQGDQLLYCPLVLFLLFSNLKYPCLSFCFMKTLWDPSKVLSAFQSLVKEPPYTALVPDWTLSSRRDAPAFCLIRLNWLMFSSLSDQR